LFGNIGTEELSENLIRGKENKYGTETVSYTYSKMNILQNDYINIGATFVENHKNKNSNKNYLTPVLFMPQRLINLIK
jgi:hypothetical protein